MICETFEVNASGGVRQHGGLARTRAPADHEEVEGGRRLIDGVKAESPQGLEAAFDPGDDGAGFSQPCLGDAGAQPAASAVERALRMRAHEGRPRLDAFGAHRATHQLLAERRCLLLTALAIARPHCGTLAVVQDWQVHGPRQRTLGKLHWRAYVDEAAAGAKQGVVIGSNRAG